MDAIPDTLMATITRTELIMSILTDYSKEELESIIEENPSLRGYLQGYLAEYALKKQLIEISGVTKVVKIPDHDPEKGDLKVTYKGIDITIESKSVRTDSIREDVLNDTWQGSVGIRSSDKKLVTGVDGECHTTSLERGKFDILAISCYAVSSKWEFLFMENEHLPAKSPQYPNLIKSNLVINPETTPLLVNNLEKVLNSVLEKKTSRLSS